LAISAPPLVYYNLLRYELNYFLESCFGGKLEISVAPPTPISPMSSISTAFSSGHSFFFVALDCMSPKLNSESGPLSILIPSSPDRALIASDPDATLMSVVFIMISRYAFLSGHLSIGNLIFF
jgi:hypothetical protein